ncbi:MAG: hypothetical protein OXM00_05425 [Paracoccaceae bacterium]|nr:hypothetical protein [Paracoccaceae bacterium]
MELAQNPFFLLEATMRDDRRHIVELAEKKTLLSEENSVREAAATLTNPRKRLAAEVGWLPGLGPKRIVEALAVLEANPVDLLREGSLPALARANLLADGLVRSLEALSLDDVAEWIVELAKAHEELDAEQTAMLLNEERLVAGFPEISDLQHVDSALQTRRQYFRQATKGALDRLPSASLVKVVTLAVDQATNNGSVHAPILIDDLVDSFEVEAQGFFEKETKNIVALVQGVRDAAENEKSETVIDCLVAKLEKVVKNWDTVAQPIQISTRSRGLSHDLSHEVAGEIRGLAVELFNKHDLLDLSKRLTALQQEVFAEVDRVVEQSEEDASALDGIAEQRAQLLANMEAQIESWKNEISYEADIGLVFKDKLCISPEGVQWKGTRISLEEITRVRWGGTEHSVNGIPTGTTYNIFVGGDWVGIRISLRKQQIYSEFIGRLWKTAGVRLLTEMLEGLQEGKRYRFGTAVITDYGVELERRHLFASNEYVPCKWTDLVIGNGAGTFYIAKKDEKKVAVELPYQEIDNVHILEAAMRVFWKKASPRLSDLLTQSH